MTPLQILKGARERITNEDNWTKGENFRDKDGSRVGRHSATPACQFCASGAIHAAVNPLTRPGCAQAEESARNSLSTAFQHLYFTPGSGPDWPANFIEFNDHPDTTHAQIMELYDYAIMLAQEKEDRK